MAQYILRCSFACGGTRAQCQGWWLSCGSGLLFAASSGAWWVLSGSRATCGAAPHLQQVLPHSVTQGWQHGGLQAVSEASSITPAALPAASQLPATLCSEWDPEKKPCTQGGCSTTGRDALSDPELSTALQRQWGDVQWCVCSTSCPKLPSLWDDCSRSPTTHIVF